MKETAQGKTGREVLFDWDNEMPKGLKECALRHDDRVEAVYQEPSEWDGERNTYRVYLREGWENAEDPGSGLTIIIEPTVRKACRWIRQAQREIGS